VGHFDDELKLLKEAGDKEIQKVTQSRRAFTDTQFNNRKALGGEWVNNYHWKRVKEIKASNQTRNAAVGKMAVIADGVNADDIKQGEIGDCYLLSAMSVIAHCNPNMIKRIFHPDCLKVREDGIYVLMLFQGGEPQIVVIDDFFPVKQNRHAFV
jgi:hypothetical protein